MGYDNYFQKNQVNNYSKVKMFSGKGKEKTKKNLFCRNAKEYTSRSSIHGIGYIFDQSLGCADQVLWLVATVCVMVVALWMITTAYLDWQENQVITTLKTTTKSVTDTEFPAITVCAGGLHMDLVEKVLYSNFEQWRKTASNETSEDEFSLFMKEKYQIKEAGLTILDILNTMISPQAAGTNSVSKNQLACAEKHSRKKRGS